MGRRKRLLAGLAGLVAVGAMAFAVWPRGARLVPYISPPVTMNGKTVRLRALVPEGWVAAAPERVANGAMRRSDGRKITGQNTIQISIAPPPPGRSWLPEWLRRRLYGPIEQTAGIDLCFGLNGAVTDGRVERRELKRATGPLHCAILGTGGESGYMLLYSRQNRAEFDRTYRTICESLRCETSAAVH